MTVITDWLKRIPPSLLKKDSTPILGFPPPFPWDQLSAKLAKLFESRNLTIKPSTIFEWKEAADLNKGIGNPIALCFALAPQGGKAWWVMSQHDVSLLMTLLLKQQQAQAEAIPQDFQEGFYHFLALETVNAITSLEFGKNLSIQMIEQAPLPTDISLCIDISATLEQKTFWGRLILSDELIQQWRERFAERTLDTPLAQSVELTIHLEAGRTALSSTQWSQLSPGDFLALDTCSLKSNGEGRVTLSSYGISLFQANIKDGSIEILEHPTYQQEEVPMTDQPQEKDNANAPQEEDEEFFDEEIEEDPPETPQANVPPPAGNPPPPTPPPAPEHHAEAQHNPAAAPDDSQKEVSGEEEGDENDIEPDVEIEGLLPPEEKWPPPPEKRHEQAQEEAAQHPQPAAEAEEEEEEEAEPESEEKQPVSLGEIPLTITVEVARIQMPLLKLMELQPGNLLDLNVHPENGVDLIVNGKRFAKAELLLIGEVLGVRILDIG